MVTGNSRPRTRYLSIYKRIQRILGPAVATPQNAAIFALGVQSLLIVALIYVIKLKDGRIEGLISAEGTITGGRKGCSDYSTDGIYGLPPKENDLPLKAAVDAANYDDMNPAITGHTVLKKYTTFFGKFLRCKPVPCTLKKWAYVGEKCFYRNATLKDAQGHNASIWHIIQDGVLYSEDNDFGCPIEICRKSWANEIDDVRYVVKRTLLREYAGDRPWATGDLLTGTSYVRLNQYFGIEYMHHGTFKITSIDDDGDDLIINKTGSIIIRRGFTHNYCDLSFNGNVPEPDVPIYIIVPYTGRIDQLTLFYKNIHQLLLQNVAVRVIIATHGGAVHTLGASELLRELNMEGLLEGELKDGYKIQVVEVRGDRDGNFSRAVALMDGLSYVPADGLTFFCDVDMQIEPQFFDNCRHNTHRNHMVYYPVVYSLYPYGKRVSSQHGYWRSGAYGMLCAYKSDIKRNAFWKETPWKLKGWGMEDVLIRHGFNMHWQINVFHAIEPNLLHRWHPKYCEWNANVGACLGTIFQNMGSQKFLASIVAAKGIDVRTIEYDPPPLVFDGYRNASTTKNNESVLEGAQAPESAPDRNKNEAALAYERAIMNGDGGLLSLFAKEAQAAILGDIDMQKKTSQNEKAPSEIEQPPSMDKHGKDANAEAKQPQPPLGN